MDFQIYDARAVANEVIRMAFAKSKPITNLEVLKLIYFAHGFMLALHECRLFWQFVIAWPHGPVVIDVYESLKIYGRDPITELIDMPGLLPLEGDSKEAVEMAFRVMGRYSASKMVGISHDSRGPWYYIWHTYGQNHIIPNDMIQEYFEDFVLVNPPLRS